jgi:hypothetical protein
MNIEKKRILPHKKKIWGEKEFTYSPFLSFITIARMTTAAITRAARAIKVRPDAIVVIAVANDALIAVFVRTGSDPTTPLIIGYAIAMTTTAIMNMIMPSIGSMLPFLSDKNDVKDFM